MKRILGLAAVLTLLGVVSASHYTQAQGPPERVEVCHVRSSTTQSDGCELIIGEILNLPDNRGQTVEQHLAHGDYLISEVEFVTTNGRGCCILFVDMDGNPKRPPRID